MIYEFAGNTDIVRRVENSFKDKHYLKLISTSRQRWFDEEIEIITKGIVDFLKNLYDT